MERYAVAIFLSVLSTAVVAQEAKPSAQTAAPSQANVSTVETSPTVLSQSKFLGLLYAEIARRTPPQNGAGTGDVSASFHVNAQGKVDKVVIDKTTSAAHSDMVKKILAAVQAPPPPGGGADISQNFKFH